MGIKEIVEKLRGIEAPDEEIDDNETKDRYLRSLRREDRIQKEEVEKEQLKIKIAEFKRARTAKHLFGIKEGIKHRIEKKQGKLLQDKVSILNSKKKGGHRKQSFLGKSNL